MVVGLLAVLMLFGGDRLCGGGTAEPARLAVLLELNGARRAAGRRLLEPHPLLCRLAGERAAAVAASGDPEPDRMLLQATTRALYRGGYGPHFWSQGTIIGASSGRVLEQLRAVRPAWLEEALAGDFEHLGIGAAAFAGQPVLSLLLGLPRCTVEWRHAAALADREAVRELALAVVNRLRAERGRPAVARDRRLDAAAQAHAEDMLARSYYAHRGPDGRSPQARARAAGYRRQGAIAENIAKGLFTPAEAVDRWMDSSGHRQNILLRRAVAAGLGVAVGPGEECVEVVWVQLLAG